MPAHPERLDHWRAALAGGAMPPGLTTSEARFAIYRNNVHHSLHEALRARFPALERLLGAECFRALSADFIAAHPPRSPVLHEWGDAMPGFLATLAPLAHLPYLADVARIELARGRAYHAADARPMPPEALLALAGDMARLQLVLVPAAEVLRLDTPGYQVWRRQQPEPPPSPVTWQGDAVFVSRRGVDHVLTRALDPAEAVFIEALRAGETCLAASRQAARLGAGFDPITVFSNLIRDGQIVAARLTGDTP